VGGEGGWAAAAGALGAAALDLVGASGLVNAIPRVAARSRGGSRPDLFVRALRVFAEYAAEPGVGGFTPSDDPLAEVSQADLDDIEEWDL
jgi:hypothetical protein